MVIRHLYLVHVVTKNRVLMVLLQAGNVPQLLTPRYIYWRYTKLGSSEIMRRRGDTNSPTKDANQSKAFVLPSFRPPIIRFALAHSGGAVVYNGE